MLCRLLHAELVVEAAVALVRQMPRDFREGGGAYPVGDRLRAGNQTADCVSIGIRIGSQVELGALDAEQQRCRVPLGLNPRGTLRVHGIVVIQYPR